MTRKKILFLVGSPNQTTQMHQIAAELPEHDCYFSQLYYDGPLRPLYRLLIWSGVLNNTIVAGDLQEKADKYLAKNGLANDFEAGRFGNRYDLVVTCTDIILPEPLVASTRTVFVQEGMTDPMNAWTRFVRKMGWMPIMGIGTALNGLANRCDVYCVASPGYQDHFARIGTDPGKLLVTGIPNFDDVAQFLDNDFPHRDYVMVATTDMRETFRRDNRAAFIRRAVVIAAGRRLLFKFHPNEHMARATAEVQRYAPPDTLIYTDGNTNHMIANCQELITQYSTVVYVGLILGKKVHSYFNMEELKRLVPVQNGGRSARNIAEVCRQFLAFDGPRKDFMRQRHELLAMSND